MNTSKLFFSAIIAVITLSFYSCTKPQPAEPVNHNSDSRSYLWSVDTVRTGIIRPLMSLWGSNENDIWFCGFTDNYSRALFHYNGSIAVPISLPEAIEPGAVFGFSPTDIWVAGDGFNEGDSLSFWHYNGSWSCTARFNIQGYEILGITDIWGDSPDNVYATGFAIHINSERVSQSNIALLFHYDGSKWTRVSIPDIHKEFSRVRRGIKGSDKYYILSSATTPENFYQLRDTVIAYEFDGKNLKTLLSTYTRRSDGIWVSEIDKQIYITQDSKIYRFRNEQLEPFLDNTYENHRIEIWGRNENDMFLAMIDGIAHYNGKNIEYIYKFSSSYIELYGLICFQNSVFILAFDSSIQSNIIIRGTAKH
ncbi:MAG: hypothetical protein Q8940_22845 [Bacteroidota bacterium]|nr:hypothetical protein [Bacteroidota bacterium]